MPNHEIDAVLLQIRTVVLELRRLEGDGLDGLVLSGETARAREPEIAPRRDSSATTRASPPPEIIVT